MDNSVDDTAFSIICEAQNSPPKRRRSTFFDRRDSMAPLVNEVGANETAEMMPSESNNSDDEELSRYLGKLNEEIASWKQERQRRKSELSKLKKLLQEANASSSDPSPQYGDLSILTEADLEFLKGKPNLGKFKDAVMDLHRETRDIVDSYKILLDREENVRRICRSKLDRVHKYLLDNSIVECEDIN